MQLLQELKEQVLMNYGCQVFPYPRTLDFGSGYRPRTLIEEKFYCANLPIAQSSLKKVRFRIWLTSKKMFVQYFIYVSEVHRKVSFFLFYAC